MSNNSAGSIKEKIMEKNAQNSRVKLYDNYQENVSQKEIYSPDTNITQPYRSPQPVSQPSYQSNAKKSMYNTQAYPCPDHNDEELTYFCFTCTKPICP